MIRCSLPSTSIAVAVTISAISDARAALIARWDFDSLQSPLQQGTGVINVAPDAGIVPDNANFAIRTNDTQTAMSLVAGNGSLQSLSANRWSTGDYAEISAVFIPSGNHSFTLTWDQTRALTGPADFRVEVSFDAYESFNVVPNSAYSVINDGAAFSGTNAWSASGSRQSAFTRSITFSGFVAPQSSAGLGEIVVRLVATGTNLGNGAARFDNVELTSSTVPAPGVMAVLGLAGFVGRRRR
jgi:MYXO-CTERM domain-containing protein